MFEYEKPLLHPDAKSFYFVSPEEQENQNSWKESFRHLVSYFSLSKIEMWFSSLRILAFFEKKYIKKQ